MRIKDGVVLINHSKAIIVKVASKCVAHVVLVVVVVQWSTTKGPRRRAEQARSVT